MNGFMNTCAIPYWVCLVLGSNGCKMNGIVEHQASVKQDPARSCKQSSGEARIGDEEGCSIASWCHTPASSDGIVGDQLIRTFIE